MRKSKFTAKDIAKILGEAEAGASVTEVAEQYGISLATFYKWRRQYGGVSVSEIKRVSAMGLENFRLKNLCAQLIENYRSGLLWDLIRECPYVIQGLKRAGFEDDGLKARGKLHLPESLRLSHPRRTPNTTSCVN
jgi:putative transposase